MERVLTAMDRMGGLFLFVASFVVSFVASFVGVAVRCKDGAVFLPRAGAENAKEGFLGGCAP